MSSQGTSENSKRHTMILAREECGLSGKSFGVYFMCSEYLISCTKLTNASPPISVQRYTADILDETKNVLLDAGMNRVLPKPEPMHAFQTELRTMIQRAAASGNVNES